MKRIIFITILTLAFCFTVFAQASENLCPKIEVMPPYGVLQPNESATVTIKASEEIKKYDVEYVWSISSGEIIKGQGTPAIEMMVTKEDYNSNITISVKIIGLPENCENTFSDIAPVAQMPIWDPINYGKVSIQVERAYLDNLLISTTDYEGSEGVIILDFDKNTPVNKRIRRIRKIIKWIKFRKIVPLNRITFMISEDDDERTIVTTVPPNYDLNDLLEEFSNDYKIVKAEEFEQKINELLPKK